MTGCARRAEGLPLPSKFLQEGWGTDLYVDLQTEGTDGSMLSREERNMRRNGMKGNGWLELRGANQGGEKQEALTLVGGVGGGGLGG